MTTTTRDRGDIIHLAGRRHLSPALDARGGPAWWSPQGEGLARCGWEPFFAALSKGKLAVATGAEPGFAPPSAPEDLRARLSHALAHSRRFWAAFRGSPPRAPPPG